MRVQDTSGAGTGWFPRTEKCKVWNRTGGASVVGEIYQMNFALTGSETTTLDNDGSDASAFANVIVSTGEPAAIYVLCLEVVADNAEMEVMLSGVAETISVTGAAAVNGALMIPASGASDAQHVGAANEKVCGIAFTTGASTTSGLFDGVNGFATFVI